jgi:hypothetical protein
MTTAGAPLELKGWLGPKTVISADAVEFTRNGQTQRIAKSFIKGFRAATGRGVTYFTLEILNEPKPLRFNVPSGRAADVRAALGDVTDLDAADMQAALEAIRKDDAFGMSPEERSQALEIEKQIAFFVNCAGGLIAAWALIYPHPYALSVIVCAAVAPAALLLTYVKQARWYLIPRKNDPHPNATIAILASAVALGFRALIDLDVLDWQQLWLFAIVGGGLATALVLAAFNAVQLKHWPAALVGVAYLLGAIAQADAQLDHTPAEMFQTQVVSMHVSHGRSTTYSAALAPWGPEMHENTYTISSSLYDQLSPGGAACVTLHRGALHLRWYVISTCAGYGFNKGK